MALYQKGEESELRLGKKQFLTTTSQFNQQALLE